MTQYEATFEIESKTDARAVRLLMEQVYDTLREELREVDQDDASPKDTIRMLETIREATKRSSPGRLTIIYEQHDEPFDG